MRVVVQRVSSASVTIDGAVRASIGPGLLILLGIGHEDGEADMDYLVRKTAALRIFNDADGVMNRSVREVSGDEPLRLTHRAFITRMYPIQTGMYEI